MLITFAHFLIFFREEPSGPRAAAPHQGQQTSPERHGFSDTLQFG
jgi:hypothetical protein